jgi:hypothetical protein
MFMTGDFVTPEHENGKKGVQVESEPKRKSC